MILFGPCWRLSVRPLGIIILLIDVASLKELVVVSATTKLKLPILGRVFGADVISVRLWFRLRDHVGKVDDALRVALVCRTQVLLMIHFLQTGFHFVLIGQPIRLLLPAQMHGLEVAVRPLEIIHCGRGDLPPLFCRGHLRIFRR